MATPTFDLAPPPSVKDSRADQWMYLLWKYLKNGVQTANASDIIANDFYNHPRGVANSAPGLDVAEKQLMLADAIYIKGRVTPNVAAAGDVAEKQMILANQIFGG